MKTEETEIILYQGGDGSNVAEAIEIIGAKSFDTGFAAIANYFVHICGFKDILFFDTDVMFYWDKIIYKINVCTKNGWSNYYFFDTTDFEHNINTEDFDPPKILINTAN